MAPERNLLRCDLLLRLESLLILAACCAAYHAWFPHHWGMYALLFLVPDLSLLGFLGSSQRVAAAVYNVAHTYALPLLLGGVSWWLGRALPEAVSLIWLSHIALDRALGYGLKSGISFKMTHIQGAQFGIAGAGAIPN